MRQVAHFRGHHREAPALLAGARCFNRRVQSEDVGLEGNAVDHADDVGNLVRASFDRPHGADHLRHHRAALGSNTRSGERKLVGLARVVGILLDGRRQLFHRAGGFLQRTGLRLGACREIGIADRDLGRRHAHRIAGGTDIDQDRFDLVDEAIERSSNLRQFVAAFGIEATRQVALTRGDVVQGIAHQGQALQGRGNAGGQDERSDDERDSDRDQR